MHATSTIPIVFGIAVDRVGTGMVASLARPGGNATGLSVQNTELPGKRIELLRQLIPDLKRMAVIGNAGYAGAVEELGEVRAVARKVGIDVDVLEIRRTEDIVPAFSTLKNGAQAL
jgi:putative ABC transport system substrate-binding protein